MLKFPDTNPGDYSNRKIAEINGGHTNSLFLSMHSKIYYNNDDDVNDNDDADEYHDHDENSTKEYQY